MPSAVASRVVFDSSSIKNKPVNEMTVAKENVEIKDDIYTFNKGFISWKSDFLDAKKNPDTGLPERNFVIELEFKTKEKHGALFSVTNSKGQYDRFFYLKNRHLYV
jgi:hypothetical protein